MRPEDEFGLSIPSQVKPGLAGAAVLGGLLLISGYNFLLFHTLAELFSVVIGCGAFMIAWNSRRFLKNSYLLLMGIACFFVAIIDLVHALAYKGMAIFPEEGANIPTQLWVAARCLESLSLLMAPLLLRRQLKAGAVFIGYAAITALLLCSILVWKAFPQCWLEGTGLTPFKLISEYIICLILAGGTILLLHRRAAFDRGVLTWLVWSLATTIAAELAFTSYVNVYGSANLLGHCLKIVSFYCIYRAIIETGLTQPYSLLLREIKQSEQQLVAAKQRLELAQMAGRIGTFDWKLGSTDTIQTEGMNLIYGNSQDQAVDKYEDWRRSVHPEDIARVEHLIAQALAGKAEYDTEYRIIWADGSIHWVGARGKVQCDGAGKAISMIGINIDLTARKEAEEASRQSEERFRVVQELSPDGFTILRPVRDAAGRVVDFSWVYENDAIARMNGTDPKAILGRRLLEVFPSHRDTQMFKAYQTVAETGQRCVLEHYYGGDSFPKPTWFRLVVVPIGREIGVLAQDITQQKEFQDELERLVAERTARLEEMVRELEHFSYAITHDMRAPLRAMKGYAEVVNELCAECPKEETKGLLRRIMVSSDRMDALIRDALNYSRAVRQELPLELVDAGALLRGMLDSYPEFQRSKAHIRVEGELPVLMANEAGLTQCFSNLLGNAVKFVKPGNIPEIRIWAEERQGWAYIWVEDQGVGVPASMLPDRIFEMFSRGHNTYDGTGIGLALVRKVMDRMGGTVGAESEEGKGSRFWLKLKPGMR